VTGSPAKWSDFLVREKAVKSQMRRLWLQSLADRFSTQSGMAGAAGISRCELRRIADGCGFKLPIGVRGSGRVSPEAMRRLSSKGMTLAEAAEALSCNRTYLSHKAKKEGIVFTPAKKRGRPPERPACTSKPEPKALTMYEVARAENARARASWGLGA